MVVWGICSVPVFCFRYYRPLKVNHLINQIIVVLGVTVCMRVSVCVVCQCVYECVYVHISSCVLYVSEYALCLSVCFVVSLSVL